jgi:large subunit ribosomal protein L29
MTAAEIRNMRSEELFQELYRLRRHLFDLRSQAVTEKLGDPTQLAKTRREIARILTVLHERREKNIPQREAHLEAVMGRPIRK